jgi:hypothetical protein
MHHGEEAMNFLRRAAIGIGRGLGALIPKRDTSKDRVEPISWNQKEFDDRMHRVSAEFDDHIQRAEDRIRQWSSPDEAELNRLSIPSTELRIEYRGDGVFRLMIRDEWYDLRMTDFRGVSAHYVAGSRDVSDVEKFEQMATEAIAEKFFTGKDERR